MERERGGGREGGREGRERERERERGRERGREFEFEFEFISRMTVLGRGLVFQRSSLVYIIHKHAHIKMTQQ